MSWRPSVLVREKAARRGFGICALIEVVGLDSSELLREGKGSEVAMAMICSFRVLMPLGLRALPLRRRRT
jgi:hypothetical protein